MTQQLYLTLKSVHVDINLHAKKLQLLVNRYFKGFIITNMCYVPPYMNVH